MAFKKKVTRSSDDAVRIKFEKAGDCVEGHLVRGEPIPMDDKDVMKYVVSTKDGNVSFLGSFKIDELLKDMPLGTMIRLTYTKKERLEGGKTLKQFELDYDDEDVIKV